MSDETETLPLEISAQDAKALMDGDKGATVIDVRERDEWEICHLEGSRLLPLSSWPDVITQGGGVFDNGKPIIVYCHHGARSLQATRFLRAQGMNQAQSMKGGIDDWADKVDPKIKKY